MVSIDLSVVICKNRSNIGTATGCIEYETSSFNIAAAAAHGILKKPNPVTDGRGVFKIGNRLCTAGEEPCLAGSALTHGIEFGGDRADLFVGDGFQVIHAVGFVDHGDKINLTVKIGRSVVVVVDTDIRAAADLKQVVVCPGSLVKACFPGTAPGVGSIVQVRAVHGDAYVVIDIIKRRQETDSNGMPVSIGKADIERTLQAAGRCTICFFCITHHKTQFAVTDRDRHIFTGGGQCIGTGTKEQTIG